MSGEIWTLILLAWQPAPEEYVEVRRSNLLNGTAEDLNPIFNPLMRREFLHGDRRLESISVRPEEREIRAFLRPGDMRHLLEQAAAALESGGDAASEPLIERIREALRPPSGGSS